MSAFLRPSFFLIGERKCGTSSLFRYLVEHPQVLPGERKEMQFFAEGPEHVEANFQRYLSRFPADEGTVAQRLCWPELNKEGILYEEDLDYPRDGGKHYITGEASAATFAEVEPCLLRRYLPDLKLIVILRDPVERAFSHHRMFLRFQEEGRDLPRVYRDFESDMQQELADFEKGRPGELLPLGLYLGTLERWAQEWGRSRLLVLFTADLHSGEKKARLMERTRKHLGLSPWSGYREARPHHNQAPKATMSIAAREMLEAFYRPYDAALGDYLQCELPWAPA